MTYQAKLIEEGLWHIFAKLFHCIHIHIKMWWSIDSLGGSNEFIWWLIKPNSLKNVRDVSLQKLSIVSTFISKCGNQMKMKEDSTRRLISRQNTHEIHIYLCEPQFICRRHTTPFQCLRWLKNRGNNLHLRPMKNSRQLIILRGIAWLAQLKWKLVKAYQIHW